VSESGYYAWRKRPLCQHQREDADLTQKIRQVFVNHQGRYGSPRILRELRDDGINSSRKRIARLMQQEELSARRKRRRVLTTKRDKTHPVAPNILNREFAASAPNKKWVTDTAVYSNSTGVALLGSYSRSLFTDGCGMESAQVIVMRNW